MTETDFELTHKAPLPHRVTLVSVSGSQFTACAQPQIMEESNHAL
jgi:hypothetical protein